MNTRDDIRSLASYVTYRELYDEGKTDVYSIISKFEENINSFTGDVQIWIN